MTTRFDYEKRLRSVENDIMWNQRVVRGARDPKQKVRVTERLTKLELERDRLKTIIREWTA